MLVDDHTDDTELLRTQIETLKCENEKILQQSDDVKNKLSNEICQLNQKLQWCQNQSLNFELQLQSQIVSNKCHNCNENELLQKQVSQYEKEIEALNVEKLEWQQDQIDDFYQNKSLASDIQDQNHIIIELKEKIKILEKGKFVSKNVIAPGMYKMDINTSEHSQITNLEPSTST